MVDIIRLDKQPLLVGEDNEPESSRCQRPSRSKTIFSSKWWLLIIHLSMLVVYGMLGLVFVNYKNKVLSSCPDQQPALKDLSLQYHRSIFHNLSQSRYAGYSDAELDKRWKELLSPSNIRVSETELRAVDQESISLPEGGGFMAWLGAFHTLHCVNMLRTWVFSDFNHSTTTQAEKDHAFPHVQHCLELLRQDAMCRPDLSLTTFKWHPNKTQPMFNASESAHQCVDWDVFLSSFQDRVIPEDEIARLKNPLLPRVGG